MESDRKRQTRSNRFERPRLGYDDGRRCFLLRIAAISVLAIFTATKWHKSLPLPDAFRSVMARSAGDVLGRELWRRQWTGKRTHSGTLPSVGHSCFGSTRDLTRQLPLCCKTKFFFKKSTRVTLLFCSSAPLMSQSLLWILANRQWRVQILLTGTETGKK